MSDGQRQRSGAGTRDPRREIAYQQEAEALREDLLGYLREGAVGEEVRATLAGMVREELPEILRDAFQDEALRRALRGEIAQAVLAAMPSLRGELQARERQALEKAREELAASWGRASAEAVRQALDRLLRERLSPAAIARAVAEVLDGREPGAEARPHSPRGGQAAGERVREAQAAAPGQALEEPRGLGDGFAGSVGGAAPRSPIGGGAFRRHPRTARETLAESWPRGWPVLVVVLVLAALGLGWFFFAPWRRGHGQAPAAGTAESTDGASGGDLGQAAGPATAGGAGTAASPAGGAPRAPAGESSPGPAAAGPSLGGREASGAELRQAWLDLIHRHPPPAGSALAKGLRGRPSERPGERQFDCWFDAATRQRLASFTGGRGPGAERSSGGPAPAAAAHGLPAPVLATVFPPCTGAYALRPGTPSLAVFGAQAAVREALSLPAPRRPAGCSGLHAPPGFTEDGRRGADTDALLNGFLACEGQAGLLHLDGRSDAGDYLVVLYVALGALR